MSMETPFGDIQCDQVKWNTAWQSAGETDPQLVCTFSETIKEYDHIELDYHYLATPGDFFQRLVYASVGAAGCQFNIHPARVRTANALAELIQFDRLKQPTLADIAGVAVDAFLLYGFWPELRNSLPLLDALLRQDYQQGGYVYVLSDQQGHYKIGKAVNLDRRIYQLKTQPPFQLQLLASAWFPHPFIKEAGLHRLFAERRMNGEWFELSEQELKTLVDSLNEAESFLIDIQGAYEIALKKQLHIFLAKLEAAKPDNDGLPLHVHQAGMLAYYVARYWQNGEVRSE